MRKVIPPPPHEPNNNNSRQDQGRIQYINNKHSTRFTHSRDNTNISTKGDANMISNIAMICPDKTNLEFSCLVTNIPPELISVKPGQVFPLRVMT